MDIKKLPQYFLVALFLFVIFFFIFVGFSFWFIAFLFLWLLFYLFFIIQKIKFFALTHRLIWIFFLILLVLSFGSIFYFKGTNGKKAAGTAKNRKLVDCTSTASDKPQEVNGWITELFPADWTGEYTPYPKDRSAQKENYSFETIGKKNVSNIFFEISKPDESYIEREMKRIIEVCDVNNKTYQYWSTKDTNTSGTSENVLKSTSYVHQPQINERSVPGKFRVDAYLYINGKWTLTDRIENVNIVK